MEQWERDQIEALMKEKNELFLYLYTPLCGTCQLAGKMIEVVAAMLPAKKWGKSDLNYLPDLANKWEIESVPCLLIYKNGKIAKKIYAFHSVPYLYEQIKSLP